MAALPPGGHRALWAALLASTACSDGGSPPLPGDAAVSPPDSDSDSGSGSGSGSDSGGGRRSRPGPSAAGSDVAPVPGEIEFVSARPRNLGVAGSGYQETSRVCFRGTTRDGHPLPAEVRMEFALAPPLGGVTVQVVSPTDVTGMACTTLHSGSVAVAVAVRARVSLDGHEAVGQSPPILIVGVIPSARGLVMRCDRWSVPALAALDGDGLPADDEVPCRLLLKDRFDNPVGLSTRVGFRTEAGQIDGTASSVPAAEGPADGGGRRQTGLVEATLHTFGPLPRDVPPFEDEPRVGEPPLLSNPRDGLVTIMAFVPGEEEFTDANGNGVYDVGEPFVDLPEPFVDGDDDGVRGAAEPFLDFDLPGNEPGRHDGPNGRWDGRTIIWTETRQVWTGAPDLEASSPVFSGCEPPEGVDCGVPDPVYALHLGRPCGLAARIADGNLNCVSGASVELALDGGSIVSPFPLPQVHDSLCMGWELRHVDAGDDPPRRLRLPSFRHFAGGRTIWAWLVSDEDAEPGAGPRGWRPSTLVLRVRWPAGPGEPFGELEVVAEGCAE